jgi:hypothetical protein
MEPDDHILLEWVRAVHDGLPDLSSPPSRIALRALSDWMLPKTTDLVCTLAIRFRLPDHVRDAMLERRTLRSELEAFLTCRGSEEVTSLPATSAYLQHRDKELACGRQARSFDAYCFYGTRTRLFAFLKRIAPNYGAHRDSFRFVDSPQTAIRRLVKKRVLVEYLRLEKVSDKTEIWCHRAKHPDGARPLNAFRYGSERRFLIEPFASGSPTFTLTAEHRERELAVQHDARRRGGGLLLTHIGTLTYPERILWVFESFQQPLFPLLGSTLTTLLSGTLSETDVGDRAVETWEDLVRAEHAERLPTHDDD